MNWMQFISSLVTSLAWPAVVLVVLFRFKAEVGNLLKALLKLKLPGGIEAEFNKDLVSVAVSVESARAEPSPTVSSVQPETTAIAPPATTRSTTFDLLSFMNAEPDPFALKANPTGVVMEAWKTLEAVLRSVSNRINKNVLVSDRLSFVAILKYLANAKFLTSEELDNLRKLKSMRDLAAHSQDPISAESANSFSEIAEKLGHILTMRMDQLSAD